MSATEDDVGGQLGQVPQAQTTRAPKRWPLVASLQTRDASLPIKWGARLINGFGELDPSDGSHWAYKRPGMGPTPFASPSSPNFGGGSYCYSASPTSPVLLFVAGTTLYQTSVVGFPFPHIVTSAVGTVDGTSNYFFETINSSPQTVVLGNGTAAYIYQPSGGTLTKITDANFPLQFVPGWVYLDGFLYIMDTAGKIWGTAGQNNAAVWSGTNVILASSNADAGVCLLKQLNYVVALKQWTSQVFYDAGNAVGSPLGVVPDAQLPLGCFIGAAAQTIDNTLLWVTTNQTIAPQVVQMDNLTPKIISTPSVERILSHATFTGSTINPMTPGGVYSWVLKLGGHRFFGLTFTNLALNITLVYDLDQRLWYIWTDANGNYWPIQNLTFFPSYVASGGLYQPGFHIAQHLTNGNMYPLDSADTYPTDYGNIVPVDIYTPNIDFGNIRRKFLRTLYFDGDKTAGSVIKVRFSDNDYQTWSNFRDVDLSLKKPRLGPCGTFDHRRAYHIRHQRATNFRLRDMDMQMDIGTL